MTKVDEILVDLPKHHLLHGIPPIQVVAFSGQVVACSGRRNPIRLLQRQLTTRLFTSAEVPADMTNAGRSGIVLMVRTPAFRRQSNRCAESWEVPHVGG